MKPLILLLITILALTIPTIAANAETIIHMDITWIGNASIGIAEIKLCNLDNHTIITIYGDIAQGGHPNPPYGIYKRTWNGNDWIPTQLIADLTPNTTGWTNKCCIPFKAHTRIDFTIRNNTVYLDDKKLCSLEKWNPQPWTYKENIKYNWYMVNTTQTSLNAIQLLEEKNTQIIAIAILALITLTATIIAITKH